MKLKGGALELELELGSWIVWCEVWRLDSEWCFETSSLFASSSSSSVISSPSLPVATEDPRRRLTPPVVVQLAPVVYSTGAERDEKEQLKLRA